jgi:hypothetical protein
MIHKKPQKSADKIDDWEEGKEELAGFAHGC